MDALLRDLKFGVKLLLKDRGFAATAILTLAVCIGANTAVFTVVNSVLLQPLPAPEADNILLMSNQYPNAAIGRSSNSGAPDYYDRLRDLTVFEEQAMFNNTAHTLDINGTPERIRGMAATPSLLRLLRVKPEHGRTFSNEEGEIGNELKVILSFGLWRQLFGGDPTAVGRELRLSGRAYTVVGVMPPDFLFVNPEVRFWTPLVFTEQQRTQSRHGNNWFNVGRLKPGATIEQAQAQVNALNAANLELFPQMKQILLNVGFYTSVEPLKEMLIADVRSTLYLLWGGAAFVLLIGAVNIGNLALARSSLRVKEVATRLALGAARAQVARQFIIESLLVALAGGVAGLALGGFFLRLLTPIGLNQIPRAGEVQTDGVVVAFAIGVALLVGIFIGAAPVLHAFKVNLGSILHEEGRSGTGGRRIRSVRRALVVAQVALAFVLLVGAGLLVASFRQLLAVDPGFTGDGVVTAATSFPRAKYPGPQEWRTFVNRTLDAVRALPGVTAAGVTSNIPLDGSSSDSVIIAEGYEMKPGESLVSPRHVIVSPGYFESLSVALIRGRYFDQRDTETAPGAVIVDERLARKFWQDRDPVGRRMYLPGNPTDLLKTDENTRWFTVVGVVRHVRMQDMTGIADPIGTYYFPFAQNAFSNVNLTIKSSNDPPALLRMVRSELGKIDPELPLFEIRTMNERLDLSLTPRRASMVLALSFGSVALFLSAIGIYGVLAYLVTQRTREIGIRIALGSTAAGVFKLVLREGLGLVAAGLLIGIAGAFAMSSAIQSQIFGVRPTDPIVIALVILTLGAVALVACYMPARRATKVDPASILNS